MHCRAVMRPLATTHRIGVLVAIALAIANAAAPKRIAAQDAFPLVTSAATLGSAGVTSPQSRDLASGPVAMPAGISRRPRPDSALARRAPSASALGAGSSRVARTEPARHDWWAPVASAILPGTGQARLGQDRFVGYLAVEGFLWVRYLTDRRAGTDARNAYRDIALRVSRAGFPGPKPQGNFEYYERMEHWIASGVYDADPTGGFAPETDTTTFNGKMWSIARTTYWSNPRTPPPVGSPPYEAALRFYRQNAVSPDFQWSWRSAPLHQDVYRRSVRASNDGFRHAAQDIGAVIANHVLSTVDAYISLRLQLGESTDTGASSVGIGATLPFDTIERIVGRPPRGERAR
jgi:hypothetical protein